MFRVLYLTIRFFTEKRVTAQAAALTYSTLLSMVPILAVVFAIARGFGYSKYIELWFRKMMSTQPQIADLIVDFVNRYLAHTQSGIFLGIGLLFMLFTVLMLVNNIEETFNEIWQVSNARPIMRSIVNYLAMFFVFPIIIIVSMGLSIFMATVADVIEDFSLLSSAVHQLFDLSNSLLMSLLFILLYVYMPNTKVKWSCALHAQYEGQVVVRHHPRHPRRCGHASPTAILYLFTDLGNGLQRHLWFVCRPPAVHAMDADLVDHLPLRCAAYVYESESQSLRYQP